MEANSNRFVAESRHTGPISTEESGTNLSPDHSVIGFIYKLSERPLAV